MSRPMTLGEIVRSEETDGYQPMIIQDIKISCYNYALESTKRGIYSPDEILEEAKKIFEWVMNET